MLQYGQTPLRVKFADRIIRRNEHIRRLTAASHALDQFDCAGHDLKLYADPIFGFESSRGFVR